jgi:hypothetical protein
LPASSSPLMRGYTSCYSSSICWSVSPKSVVKTDGGFGSSPDLPGLPLTALGSGFAGRLRQPSLTGSLF